MSKSINVTKKDTGVKCVVNVKSKGTQLERENPVSYRKGNDHPQIMYRYLLTNIIASKDSAMEYCFATEILLNTRPCPTCGENMILIKDLKVSD